MNKMAKWLVIGLVLVLAGTYAIYVLDYRGNYNVTAKVKLSVDTSGTVAVSEFSTSCAPTSPVQFWDLFKGHSAGEGTGQYIIYYWMNVSGKTLSGTAGTPTIDYGSSGTALFTIANVPVGVYTLHLSLRDSLGTMVLSKSYEVTVGP